MMNRERGDFVTTNKGTENISILKTLLLIFIPTSLLMLVYIVLGSIQNTIPSLLLFMLCAALILFPIEIGVVLHASKTEYGSFSLKSSFSRHNKMSRLKIFLYGFGLCAFAGIISVTVAPLENNLLAPVSNMFTGYIPEYFNWNNIEQLKMYPNNILLTTCIVYSILNVIVGPIIEELFFRGYLTSKLSRYGDFAPLIITVLFSLYHFWLPFENLFRIFVFFPAAFIAWKKKNIYITIVFHCMCNLLSTIAFFSLVF